MKYCIICREDEYSKEIEKILKKRILHIYDENEPDFVLAVGGDGTIIVAAHRYPSSIIFGLHTGHLGFLANYNPDTLEALIHDVNEEDYKIESIPLMKCVLETFSGMEIEEYAINEVTAIQATRTFIADVFIDKDYLETFRGTGLCISTTYGSTAYNKSLYGGVVDHELRIMQLAEIASINSNAYRTLSSPLIVSDQRVLTISSDKPIDISITVDHMSHQILGFKKMSCSYDGKLLKMAYHEREGFISKIRRSFLDSKK